MFWFDACWGIRAELLSVNYDFDIVKLVVDPPVTPSDQSMKKMFLAHASVQFVLTLEASRDSAISMVIKPILRILLSLLKT